MDRRKNGTKHHLLTDGSGRAPMAVRATGANRHDVTQLLPLLDAVPAVRGRRGRPRRRFERVQGDRAYDSDPHRRRWVIERAQAWLHQPRRLKLRYEKRADVHDALLELSCILMCHNALSGSFC